MPLFTDLKVFNFYKFVRQPYGVSWSFRGAEKLPLPRPGRLVTAYYFNDGMQRVFFIGVCVKVRFSVRGFDLYRLTDGAKISFLADSPALLHVEIHLGVPNFLSKLNFFMSFRCQFTALVRAECFTWAGQHRYWNQLARPYLLAQRAGQDLFNLTFSVFLLRRALSFTLALSGKRSSFLLFALGHQTSAVLANYAVRRGQPFLIGPYIGGTLTNFTWLSRQGVRAFGNVVRLPSALLLAEPVLFQSILSECVLMGIPSISFGGSSFGQTSATYPVPVFTTSAKFYRLLLGLFSKAVVVGRRRARSFVPLSLAFAVQTNR